MRTIPVTFLLLLFAWTMSTCAETGRIRQKRAWIIDSFSIEEENPGPFPYKLGQITLEREYFVNFKLHEMDTELKNFLTIDKKTGELYVNGKVDYEAVVNHTFILRFEAVNRSNNAVDTRLGVEIKILDINDNPPIFQQSKYEVSVEESHAQGAKVAMVFAFDKDDPKTVNGTFSFTIKSVTPKTDNVEFYIQQNNSNGTIYFKGCLDYEKAYNYTILVEAKDHGEKKQLSSTSTVTVTISDQNNHLPEFSGQTNSGKVKERNIGTKILRLQVTDKDSRGSIAWEAKYTIEEDTKNMFKIETDPTTNEGILTVVKPMDYEEQTYQTLTISVKNEAPYFSCKIKKRPQDAMWELDRFFESPSTSDPKLYKSITVTIYVEDINDPPVFILPVTEITVMENTDARTYLTTVTAIDSDKAYANTIRYVKGSDVAGWITVDKKTGNISTAKIIDRESQFVKNSVYEAIVYAVDDGTPPLTGTGTVRIYVIDQNDIAPMLMVDHVNVCLDKEPSTANITAVDLDLPPYSSPFHYELLGDVEGKWRIHPVYGTIVDLVKESNVYSGRHLLQIRISDQQGFSTIQNLTVIVCNCTSVSSCERMMSKARMGGGGICVIIIAVLLLTGMPLMALFFKRGTVMFPIYYEGSSYLMKSNIEHKGTDCEMPLKVNSHQQSTSQATYSGRQNVAQTHYQMSQRSIFRNSSRCPNNEVRNFQRSSFTSSSSYNGKRKILSTLINQRLLAVHDAACDADHDAYEPHCYAHEGEFIASGDLDAISIAEMDFIPEMLNNLDHRFTDLATICRPDLFMKNL